MIIFDCFIIHKDNFEKNRQLNEKLKFNCNLYSHLSK